MARSERTRFVQALLAVASISMAGCSLIASGDQFQGGDAGAGSLDAGDGGSTTGDSSTDGAGPIDAGGPQARLAAVEAARRAEFCACFFATFLFDNEAQCISGLDPGIDYETCTQGVFATNPPAYGPGVACNATAQEAALACERAANCAVGEFNDCQLRLNEELFTNPSCLLDDEYFSDVAECAREEVVGDPQGSCPGPMLSGSFIVGDTVGSGNDFDLVDSMCFPTNDAGDPVKPRCSGSGVPMAGTDPR